MVVIIFQNIVGSIIGTIIGLYLMFQCLPYLNHWYDKHIDKKDVGEINKYQEYEVVNTFSGEVLYKLTWYNMIKTFLDNTLEVRKAKVGKDV